MISLRNRVREAEWMDEPGADPALLGRSLGFLRRINVILGYTRSTLWHLGRFSRNWKQGQTISILDVATGSADVPRAVAKWARRRGFELRVVGLDRHPRTAEFALGQTHKRDGEIRIVRADAGDLPFADGSFDYAVTSLFLHHLDDDAIVRALREMDRVARRGVIVGDLVRNRRALGWITLFTLFANPMVRHDALASVRQAFTRDEAIDLRRRAGIEYARYHRHFGHRFVLAGEKACPPLRPLFGT